MTERKIKCTYPTKIKDGKPDPSSPKCGGRFFDVFFNDEDGMVSHKCHTCHNILTSYHLIMTEVNNSGIEPNTNDSTNNSNSESTDSGNNVMESSFEINKGNGNSE
jgi:hypothetical protein